MSKLIDITNQKFGRLTVLYRVQNIQPTMWHCKCDCGNECDVRGTYLRNGHTTSCGCIKKEKCQKMGKNNIHDLTGQKFGYLTVLERTNNKTKTNIRWKCKCECGNITEVTGADLVCGKTKSCGCQRYNRQNKIKPMIGKKFGKLLVLEVSGKDLDGSYNYLCQCDCGNKKVINGVSLRSGATTSCGCINYSIGEQNIKQVLEENNISYIKEFSIPQLFNYRFDFALISENKEVFRLVEFDGRQHYEQYWNSSWEENCPLSERQQRDKEKNEYALKHNIPLVRIPYWERDKITLDMILGEKYLVKE